MATLNFRKILHDMVIIEPDILPENNSGIMLTEEQVKKVNTGRIVAMGAGKYAEETGVLIPMEVQVGDRVYFERSAAVPYMDTDYLSIAQPYIKSIIN